MLIVGLTGGIGAGKSAVAALFEKYNVVIVDADKVAREVVEPGSPALIAIAERHGEGILLEDGALDRAQLRKIVFGDEQERFWLESVTHPAIRQTIDARLTAPQSADEASYRILESPLLLETNQRDFVKRICVVDAEEQVQIQRVMARDGSSEEQVKAIIATQMPRAEKLKLADDIIDNSGDSESLQQQVTRLHEFYSSLST